VDFEKFSLKKWSNKINTITGVELVMKPKRHIDSRFQTIEDYREWSKDTLERISYRCSQELLFWRNVIEFV
jgi:hypothetical protein